MTYHTKTTGLAGVAALAVGALLAFAPMKAEAATLRIEDISGGGAAGFFLDTSASGPLASASTTNFQIGSMFIDVSVNPEEIPGLSFLSTIAVTTRGAGNIRITASQDGFGEGASSPVASDLTFSISSTRMPSADSVTARAWVNQSNVLEDRQHQIGFALGLTGPIGQGPSTPLTKSDETVGSGVLMDPFSITAVYEINRLNGETLQFNSTATVSAVPLPASALLLLGGLGGLGGISALRRRKRAA